MDTICLRPVFNYPPIQYPLTSVVQPCAPVRSFRPHPIRNSWSVCWPWIMGRPPVCRGTRNARSSFSADARRAVVNMELQTRPE